MAKKSATKGKRKSTNGAARASVKKMPTIKAPLSKTAVIRMIAEATDSPKKTVVAVFDCMGQIIEKSLKPGGPGVIKVYDWAKFESKKRPARAARKGINPFTGEEIMIKARPASRVVKIKPLKKLKEMVL